MCGISGWIGAESIPLDVNEFCKNSIKYLLHRGPDGNGYWIEKKLRVVFCHTRLAVIGLDNSGAQPMECVNGKWQIVFNGEIYNYKQLKNDLTLSGYEFISNTDTEIIAASFDKWGISAFSRLRGMYAVALWNKYNHEGYLARDPFGIKPLYIKKKSQGLFFSSELRLLLKISGNNNLLNTDAVAAYLATGSVPEPMTIISGIEMINPGTILHVRNGQIVAMHRINFCSVNQKLDNIREGAYKIRISLLDSVKSHLVSDVRVGLFLSGGVDSSCIAASLAALGRNDTACFTISFGKDQLSEGDTAKKTSRYFGLDFNCREISEDEALTLYEQYQNCLDQPSIDGFNTYLVSQFAASLGYKVALSGLGGDELFGGYSSFRRIPKLLMIAKVFKFFGKSIIPFLAKIESPRMKRFTDILASGGNIGSIYRSYRSIFSESEITQIMKLIFKRENILEWKKTTDNFYKYDNILDTISELEIKKYMLNQLLRDSDVMSMANNLELRIPFLDPVLYSVISQLPSNLRYQKAKKLLIEAFPELPVWVKNSKKKGFFLPFQSWLKNSWRYKKSWIAERLEINVFKWYRKIALLTLESWLSRNLGIHKL